jgi:serine protease Do
VPQLRTGKITRGRIGVSVGAIAREAVDEFGLKDRKGAVVQSVSPDSAASKAGLEPGDVIIGWGGKPVSSRDELVRMSSARGRAPTVPVRIMRDRMERTVSVTVDELDLEAETSSARSNNGREPNDPAQETSSGFGITLQKRHTRDRTPAAPGESTRCRRHGNRARQPCGSRRHAARRPDRASRQDAG